MGKPFRVDFARRFRSSPSSPTSRPPMPSIPRSARNQARQGFVPQTVRGLPWSKMLRSFREKSAS
jgi:hypothetical protein